MTADDYKAVRKSLGLTQAQLATELQVTREAVVRREKAVAVINKEAELAILYLQARLNQK